MKCPHCGGTGEIAGSLGALIATRRKALGLTQGELSERCQVGRTQITNIEAGRSDVPTSTLLRIAAALECRAGDLLP